MAEFLNHSMFGIEKHMYIEAHDVQLVVIDAVVM